MNQLDLSCYSKKRFAEYPCLHRININSFFAIFPDERLYDKLSEL